MKQTITEKTTSIWYPKLIRGKDNNLRYRSSKPVNPKYPVYILSKGRYKKPWTALVLEKMNVPFHIVIEPQEFEEYNKIFPKDKIHVLPFSNLGKGSIPARNWCWEHSISIGAEYHWVMDDNIDGFCRMNNNRKIFCDDGTIFRCAEDFVSRYENIAISGLQYRSFSPATEKHNPYLLNARIYSCLLIRNDITDKNNKPFRWRGRYNEDTDLSLRVLKDGWCTVLFYSFLQGKITTMKVKGGNTDKLYDQKEDFDGRYVMMRELIKQHPDCVTENFKFGRWYHQVDYSKFKNNKLILKKDIIINDENDEYGMEIFEIEPIRGYLG